MKFQKDDTRTLNRRPRLHSVPTTAIPAILTKSDKSLNRNEPPVSMNPNMLHDFVTELRMAALEARVSFQRKTLKHDPQSMKCSKCETESSKRALPLYGHMLVRGRVLPASSQSTHVYTLKSHSIAPLRCIPSTDSPPPAVTQARPGPWPPNPAAPTQLPTKPPPRRHTQTSPHQLTITSHGADPQPLSHNHNTKNHPQLQYITVQMIDSLSRNAKLSQSPTIRTICCKKEKDRHHTYTLPETYPPSIIAKSQPRNELQPLID